MKINLSLLDRIILQNSLPTEGKFEDLIIRKKLLEKVSITTQEISEFSIKTTEAGAITWDDTKCKKDFEYETSVLEVNYLNKWLIKLDESEKMNVDLVDLYEKIKGLL